MFATTKLVRKLARSINGSGFGYAGTFTDKVVKDMTAEDNGLRHVAFRFYSKAEADRLAAELKAALFIAGFENYKVKRTSSKGLEYRSGGGEYVRVKALLG